MVNGTGNSPSPGQPTPGVVKQDKSSRGSVDTTKTRSGPQRVRMSGGERPIGAAKGKQSDTEALCQPPPPSARATSLSEQQQVLYPQLSEPCPTLPFTDPTPSPVVRGTVSVVSIKVWDVSVALKGGVGGNRAPGPHAHRTTATQATDGLWTEARGQQNQSNDPHNNQHNPQYANYWAPLTRKRDTRPHSAQPQHTNHWALRTRKRHQREHRPQRPTESSDPTQHAKGRTGDCPGPRKETATRRNVTRGAG